jgi:hypothetical protein
MNPRELLAELHAAGITLAREGDDLFYETRVGVKIAPHRDRIVANKPALLAALTPLDAEIVADEAGRRSSDYVAQRLGRVAARIDAGVALPGDWLALRYWEAIRDEQQRRSMSRGAAMACGSDEAAGFGCCAGPDAGFLTQCAK